MPGARQAPERISYVWRVPNCRELADMKQNRWLAIRLVLLAMFTVFVAVFAASQYGLVRSFVRFLCVSCLGLG